MPASDATRERKPAQTRDSILQAAFQEIYRNGYQGMRLDEVLEVTGLTKGALYYHFPNKLALGYAVVDEVIEVMVKKIWVQPLKSVKYPLNVLIGLVESLEKITGPRVITYGCPLNNLAQEMSPLDEGFRSRIDRLLQLWHSGFVSALSRAQDNGQLQKGVNCQQTATIVIAALEGCIGLAKNAQQITPIRECSTALAAYLKGLRTSTALQ